MRTASGAGTTASYEYDPAGPRRAKIVNGVTTRYASEGAEEIEERDGSQVVLRKYVYGAGVDDRVAMLDATCAVVRSRTGRAVLTSETVPRMPPE